MNHFEYNLLSKFYDDPGEVMTYSRYTCCNMSTFVYHNDANNTMYGTPSNSWATYTERWYMRAYGTYSSVDAYFNITVLYNDYPYLSGSYDSNIYCYEGVV